MIHIYIYILCVCILYIYTFSVLQADAVLVIAESLGRSLAEVNKKAPPSFRCLEDLSKHRNKKCFRV